MKKGRIAAEPQGPELMRKKRRELREKCREMKTLGWISFGADEDPAIRARLDRIEARAVTWRFLRAKREMDEEEAQEPIAEVQQQINYLTGQIAQIDAGMEARLQEKSELTARLENRRQTLRQLLQEDETRKQR